MIRLVAIKVAALGKNLESINFSIIIRKRQVQLNIILTVAVMPTALKGKTVRIRCSSPYCIKDETCKTVTARESGGKAQEVG
jgi:hypothetical protein